MTTTQKVTSSAFDASGAPVVASVVPAETLGLGLGLISLGLISLVLITEGCGPPS